MEIGPKMSWRSNFGGPHSLFFIMCLVDKNQAQKALMCPANSDGSVVAVFTVKSLNFEWKTNNVEPTTNISLSAFSNPFPIQTGP